MEKELITEEFADIDVSSLPKFYDVDKLSSGCFAQRFSGSAVRKPSLLFVERIDMHESGGWPLSIGTGLISSTVSS